MKKVFAVLAIVLCAISPAMAVVTQADFADCNGYQFSDVTLEWSRINVLPVTIRHNPTGADPIPRPLGVCVSGQFFYMPETKR